MNDKKKLKFLVTDPDSFMEVLEGVVEAKYEKRMPLRHLANLLACVCDEVITNYDSISESYADQESDFVMTFKAKLNRSHTVLDLAFKPTADFKDSTSRPVGEAEDPGQSTFTERPVDPEKGKRGGTVMELPTSEPVGDGKALPVDVEVVDEDLDFEDEGDNAA